MQAACCLVADHGSGNFPTDSKPLLPTWISCALCSLLSPTGDGREPPPSPGPTGTGAAPAPRPCRRPLSRPHRTMWQWQTQEYNTGGTRREAPMKRQQLQTCSRDAPVHGEVGCLGHLSLARCWSDGPWVCCLLHVTVASPPVVPALPFCECFPHAFLGLQGHIYLLDSRATGRLLGR